MQLEPVVARSLMGYFRKKSKQRGVEDILFWIPLDIFIFLLYPLEIPDKTKLNPWVFHKIVLHPLETWRSKAKIPGYSTLFFLVIPGNSSLFLINPWKLHMLLLWYPWKFHILNPTVWIFSGIAQYFCPVVLYMVVR